MGKPRPRAPRRQAPSRRGGTADRRPPVSAAAAAITVSPSCTPSRVVPDGSTRVAVTCPLSASGTGRSGPGRLVARRRGTGRAPRESGARTTPGAGSTAGRCAGRAQSLLDAAKLWKSCSTIRTPLVLAPVRETLAPGNGVGSAPSGCSSSVHRVEDARIGIRSFGRTRYPKNAPATTGPMKFGKTRRSSPPAPARRRGPTQSNARTGAGPAPVRVELTGASCRRAARIGRSASLRSGRCTRAGCR